MIRTAPWIALTVLIGLALAALFLTFPEIDLYANGLFYLGKNDFTIRNTWIAWAVANILRPAFTLFSVGLALLVLVRWLTGWPRRMRRLRGAVFVALCLAVGPGLVANALFKENWGRARPKQVVEFAGERKFTPPLIPTDQCSRNCSFVSGDASFAFGMLSLALLAGRRRALWVSGSLAFGLGVGGLRMMNGSHFFSDVLFAGVFVAFCCLVLYRWVIEGRLSADVDAVFGAAWRRRRRQAEKGGADLLR